MGERQSDGGPAGRRRVHPEGTPPGHRTAGRDGSAEGRPHAVDTTGLEALLAASLVRDSVDDTAEQRAVAAFRAAREAGAHRARTRRRDDWRPRRRRLGSRSVKTVLSVLLGGLALGGVAVAGIGTAGPATDGPARDDRRTHASPDTPGPSAAGPAGESTGPESAPAPAPAGPDRPAAARDVEAHCRAYEKVEGRGKALDATAWKRLTAAAGGAAKVDAYCAERLKQDTAEERRGGPEGEKSAGGAGRAGNGSSGTSGGDPADHGDDGSGDDGSGADGSGADGSGADGSGTANSGSDGSGAANSGSGSGRGKPAQPGAGTP